MTTALETSEREGGGLWVRLLMEPEGDPSELVGADFSVEVPAGGN